MRFLLDVNVSGSISKLLVDLSHDIACVSDLDAKMIDSEILNWAVREKRIIITTDSDFEQIIWLQQKKHCGILRLENLPRARRLKLFHKVLINYSQELLSGAIIIATEQKIRIRRSSSQDG